MICRDCGSYHDKNWADVGGGEFALSIIATREVEKNLVHSLEDVKTKVTIIGTKTTGNSLVAEIGVDVDGKSQGLEYLTKLTTVLEIKEVLCPNCNRRAGGYYEAIVQLRADNVESRIEETHTILSRLYARDKKAFIVEEMLLKGGADIKLGSTKAAKAVASHFKNKYGAEIKESASLVGRKEGKNLYRTTVLIRM